MAAKPSETSFKGKAAVYYRSSEAYFVVKFTCSPSGTTSTLSGNWTWEDSSGVSYSGSLLGNAGCQLGTGQAGTGTWSSSFGTLYLTNPVSGPTLTLTLSNISRTKAYVSNTTTYSDPDNLSGCVDNPGNPPCIVRTTHGLGAVVGSDDTDFEGVS